MEVLALIESARHVCYRYRFEAFASILGERGWTLWAVPFRRNILGRIAQLLAARRADAVIVQRKLLPRWQLWFLRRLARCLVFDLDDAVFQRDSFHPKGQKSSRRLRQFRAMVRSVDAVIAGNGYLKQSVAAHRSVEGISVIPTCVEPDLYSLARHARLGGETRLAWIGSASTLQGLKLAEPHLLAAAQRLPGLEARLISDCSTELAGLHVTLRPWSVAAETEELAECDIGVTWLPNDSWSRGKCGLKVLQYMAAGLPVVANPVGMNREMVIHGQTGFLATTTEQWAEAIATLAADAQLRRSMGEAGRRVVEEQYSVAVWGPRLAAVLEAAVETATTGDTIARGRAPAPFSARVAARSGNRSLGRVA